jgi:hypothetical protein
VEATVQRARPVILTALAAILAFVPLTHSVFWGSLAYTLIGGTAVGTVLTLVFLPALYAIWFRVKPAALVTSDGADQPIQGVPPEPGIPAPDATAWAFRADWRRPTVAYRRVVIVFRKLDATKRLHSVVSVAKKHEHPRDR